MKISQKAKDYAKNLMMLKKDYKEITTNTEVKKEKKDDVKQSKG